MVVGTCVLLPMVVVLACVLPHGDSLTLTQEEIDIFTDYDVEVIPNTIKNTWTLKHHGVPEHGFEGGFGDNPNQPTAQNYTFEVPQTATVVRTKGCVGGLGPIGMSISGAAFYNPYTGEGNNAVDGSCKETFDKCSGHPSPNGAYHYHKLPSCLYNGTGNELMNRFLGVAFDGYPIYGPMDETGKNWTSKELDQCHGHTHNGRYMYRITYEFPYILGCYHGDASIQQSMQQGGGGQPTMGGAPPNEGPPRNGGQPPNDGQPLQMANVTDEMRVCLNVKDLNWPLTTCYAFCEYPSNGSYDKCSSPSTIKTDTDTNGCPITQVSTIVMLVAMYLFIAQVFAHMHDQRP